MQVLCEYLCKEEAVNSSPKGLLPYCMKRLRHRPLWLAIPAVAFALGGAIAASYKGSTGKQAGKQAYCLECGVSLVGHSNYCALHCPRVKQACAKGKDACKRANQKYAIEGRMTAHEFWRSYQVFAWGRGVWNQQGFDSFQDKLSRTEIKSRIRKKFNIRRGTKIRLEEVHNDNVIEMLT